MQGFQQSETCKACQAMIRQASDDCPSCGAHLFWLVVPKRVLSPLERKQFVREMLQTTQLTIDPDYLDVDGHLWLPGDFWQQDPDGQNLRIFPWLATLELHQHTSTANEAQPTPFQEAALEEQDTLPGVTEAELAAKHHSQKKQSDPLQTQGHEIRAEAETDRYQAQVPNTRQKKTTASPQKTSKQQRPQPTTTAMQTPEPKVVAPLACFLFFVLLGLSYLSLYVQKNQRDIAFTQAKPAPIEIPVEASTEESDQ